ncbi:MAG: hypothetical protein COT88_01130 [Candidatus Colwellbacteria bacterium CG10_big_fil_rev_8_21_14_0_10_41_28]|uniref:Penicillin-binding protein 2 n=1 Tax=Candidatus Colwellbacteria bacterium CG10_big_fil_rev_8_21_14_0_10_41_28 TaxID=1974539 RepID=A0A2H0VHD5_9BACT|nr:MAG: hypothetical protein COT88_01130 [Candidatus Colwellbacteria bacterium CG10_big_fil_rev_8_21_14_0_10_41_28]
MGSRITILVGLFALLYAVLGFRFYDVQIREGSYYEAQASSIHTLGGFLIPKRGDIYFTDKDGGKIHAAINKDYPVVYAVPDEVEDPESAASLLFEILGESKEVLLERLEKENDPYEPLHKEPTDEMAEKVESLGIEGVYVGSAKSRFYPRETTGSHIVGYVSENESVWLGKYGIESYYNQLLGGIAGESEGDKLINPKNGKNIQLTIDTHIQNRAETIIKDLVEDWNGSGGLAMVSDPETGKILAMASYPTFDPNNYGQYDVGVFLNPAVQAIYEPGSIFKVITMVSALDDGAVHPEDTFYDSGELTLNAHTIHNWDLKSHGTVTMSNILEKSLNTGAAYVQRQLGNEKFYNYLNKFGLNDKTDIDLPGEVQGSLLPLEVDIRDINYATASFGQGISVTPIGLLQALGAVANGGELMRPYVNADNKPQKIRRVISEKASEQVTEMLISAVDKAYVAKIEGYSVAGKTGTAQVPDINGRGGYTDDVINTYIGYAPAKDPKFVIFIRLEKPAGAPLAGLTVVPAFRELAEFVINYYQIPPDRIDIE